MKKKSNNIISTIKISMLINMLIMCKFHIIYIVVIHIKHVRYSYILFLCVLTNDELLYNCIPV